MKFLHLITLLVAAPAFADCPVAADLAGSARMTIGKCAYDMTPGKVTYTNSEYVVFKGLHYLPALGFSPLHRYQVVGEATSSYTATRIEAVK